MEAPPRAGMAHGVGTLPVSLASFRAPARLKPTHRDAPAASSPRLAAGVAGGTCSAGGSSRGVLFEVVSCSGRGGGGGARRRGRRLACQPSGNAAVSGSSGSPADMPAAARPAISPGLWKRIVSSCLLGAAGAAVIAAGSWPYCLAACLVAYQASQEFFGFVTSKGISAGNKPPPPALCAAISASCVGFIVWMHVTNGAATAMLAVSSFLVLSLQLLMVEQPRFAQLTSSVFGLFYCGYLPSFWVKLRLLSAPVATNGALQSWGGWGCLGGMCHCTVGLVATLMAVLCVVAADTGAYFCGKTFGRTQLIPISPKKTVEGALGGLLCSCLAALAIWRATAWPASPAHALLFGVIVFFSSLFGDLIESVMKREAGLKDAGNLIPGHGGLLDRFDSYLFTGGVVYFYAQFVLPMWGV